MTDTAVVEPAPPRAGQRFLTIEEVMARTCISKSTIYQMMRDGKFPKQRRVGHGSRWLEAELDDWILSRPIA